MKVGIIGAGYWGIRHVEKFVKLGEEVIVADLREEILKNCAERFGVRVTKDYRELLADPEVKAIVICVPNEYHYEIAKECLEAGKNILVEKPITTKIEDAEHLVRIAREKDLILATGHIYRFNNAIKKVKEILERDGLGEIYNYKVRWLDTVYENLPGYIETKKDIDVILDLAPHAFDILHYVTGKNIEEISAVGGDFYKSGRADIVSINCKIGKIPVNIELSWVSRPKRRELVITGRDKTLIVGCASQEIKIINKGGEEKKIKVEENDVILFQDRNFLRAIENKDESLNIASGKVGLQIVKDITQARSSLS